MPRQVRRDRDRAAAAGQSDRQIPTRRAQPSRDVPLECSLDDIRFGRMDRAGLVRLFTDLEFRRLADEFAVADEAAPRREGAQLSFEDGGNDAAQCSGLALLTSLAAVLPEVIQDDEGRKIVDHFCVSAGGVVFRFTSAELEGLSDVWSSDVIQLCVYDAKPFLKALGQAGIVLKARVFDAMLAGYLLKSGLSAFTIATLAQAYLDTAIADGEARSQGEVAALEKLYAPLSADLVEKKLQGLFENIEMPLCAVLADMELEGVHIDRKKLAELSAACEGRIKAMTDDLYALAGGEFNLNSPKQLGVVLFEKLGLPVLKKTKTGPSTDEEVLTRLAPMHQLPALILEYRQLAKLKSTYLDALPRLADESGRIHCSFNQAGAETGRLSADHPNLQNIPVRTEMGREIRKAFVPSVKGRVLVAADYSQIELRFLAHLAEDPKLIEAFTRGEDIHAFTAALIFEVSAADVTSEMRYRAKRINFGIIYGMSAYGLAKDLGVPPREAQDFIDRYFLRYPGIEAFMARCADEARQNGFVATMFGRRRYLPEINSRNGAIRQFAERQAVNTPVQGAAADLIKLAMVRAQKMLQEKGFDAKMVITVHDELVFDASQSEVAALAAAVSDVMEHAVTISVPVVATVKAGPNWAEMKEL